MAVDDLVVVVPGVMGSALLDRDGREVWGAAEGGALRALRTLGRSIKRLELPRHHGDAGPPDGVSASRVLGSFHAIPGVWTPVKGYDNLLKFLRSPRVGLLDVNAGDVEADPGNLLVFPYDWRLSNRYSAELLRMAVVPALERWRSSRPERAEARLVLICHSMGGLVARWYLDVLGGAEVTRLLITLGTPYRGALNAIDQLVNGVRKGPWVLRVNLTDFARSLPSSYQLLPEYACIEGAGAGDLRKTTEVTLPGLDPTMVTDAMSFHSTTNDKAAVRPAMSYQAVPIVGIDQPTWTTCRFRGEGVEALRHIGQQDQAGDGTVPRLSARPFEMGESDVAVRGLAEGHGGLHFNGSVFDQLQLLLTAQKVRFRDVDSSAPSPKVAVDDLHVAGEPVAVTVSIDEPRLLEAVAVAEDGREVAGELVHSLVGQTVGEALFDGLPPGGYTILVRAPDDPAAVEVSPVQMTTLVLEGGE